MEGITPSEAKARRAELWRSSAKALGRNQVYIWAIRVVILVLLSLVIWEPTRSPHSPAFSWTIGTIELSCLVVLLADQLRFGFSFGMARFREKKWSGAFLVVLVVCWLDWFMEYPGHLNLFRFSRPLRPVLLISYSPDLRRITATMLFTLITIADILLLLAIFVLFFSVLATQLFNADQVFGYPEDEDNFDGFAAAAYVGCRVVLGAGRRLQGCRSPDVHPPPNPLPTDCPFTS